MIFLWKIVNRTLRTRKCRHLVTVLLMSQCDKILVNKSSISSCFFGFHFCQILFLYSIISVYLIWKIYKLGHKRWRMPRSLDRHTVWPFVMFTSCDKFWILLPEYFDHIWIMQASTRCLGSLQYPKKIYNWKCNNYKENRVILFRYPMYEWE